jgi:hypothetical protein
VHTAATITNRLNSDQGHDAKKLDSNGTSPEKGHHMGKTVVAHVQDSVSAGDPDHAQGTSQERYYRTTKPGDLQLDE